MDYETVPGGAQTAYNSWWGCPLLHDLTTFDGTHAITDDDVMHLWMNMSHPHLTEELRIYLVVSDFDPTILPGTSATKNVAYYLKTFRQNDFSQAIQGQQAYTDAAEVARVRALRDQNLKDRSEAYSGTGDELVQQIIASRDPGKSVSEQAGAGAEEWVEFGVVDVPLRRLDFQRGGANVAGADWSTVTGIILYISVAQIGGPVAVRFTDLHIEGGYGPDTIEPGDQQYDYRYTHYDPRTGAEGNPSPEFTDVQKVDAIRRGITVLPTPYGDGAIHQRIYRRGGTLIADWYFVGETTGDGVVFQDEETDDGIVNAGTVNLDHYEPVATVDDAGNTVLAQPVPVLFGPAQGLLFALGDPYRPGHLYWCIPDEPDHWPVESNLEVCSPSEELMAGLMFGAQPFCFSRERLYAIYPNLTGTTEVTVTTTPCRRGLVSRWAWTVGLGGIFGVAKDGIFVTAGGVEQLVSLDIQPLFRGQVWNGYQPVDFTVPTAIRLTLYQDQLFFHYQGQDGNRYLLVYSLIFKFWSPWSLGMQTTSLTPDDDTPIANLVVGGLTSGKAYLLDSAAFSDDGVAIACTVRTGNWDLGRPREDKLLGDQILDCDTQGVTLSLINRLNNGTVTNLTNAITGAAGRQRFILDGFGTTPQRARNISTEISWASATARPTLYFLGLSTIPEPDVTIARVTQWDDLERADESYVTGITFDCDTGGQEIVVFAERDFDGQTTIMDTLVVRCDGRHKIKFSWADPTTGHGFQAHKVRIRPEGNCDAWILYRADWTSVAEPPRLARWDIHFEADGDQYYTGLDLYCDTNGLEKRIQIEVDGQILHNDLAGLPYWPITTVGRQWIHFTLPWGRGHVFHFHAIDLNAGLLYKHKWWAVPEPSEQANWNQNFSIDGTLADKWYKAFLFEVDTFGQTKNIEVQLDGVTVETFPVVTSGRKVVHHAMTQQFLGRVLRVFPVDGNPSRPYSILPIFDVEPYQLTRWETQEQNFDIPGFFLLLESNIALKSTGTVTFTIRTYVNQTGTIVEDAYEIPSTGGVKDKRFVPFVARKGVLVKFIFSAEAAFWLYEEESDILLQAWGGDPQIVRGLGNDDQDRTRNMVVASDAAARSGGGT
jgi:hypothetical protein